MSCFNPRLAVDYGLINPETGKHFKPKFLPKRPDYNLNDYRSKYGDALLLLPCGECLGCKFDRARDWATRCYCESLYYQFNSFITLTYDNAHLPKDKKLHREDVDDFIKQLRNRGFKFRYFGCGEYGSSDKTRRPHFHLILFGFTVDDLVLYSKSCGFYLFSSEFLEKIWSRGFVVIGNASFETASYVARYTTKKLGDDDSFIMMSNRPGIGYQYCIEHAQAILRNDKVYGRFGSNSTASVPKYFDKILSGLYPSLYAETVKKRVSSAFESDINRMVHFKTGHKEIVDDARSSALFDKLDRIGRL